MTSDAQHLALLLGEVRGDVKAMLVQQEKLERNLDAAVTKLDGELSDLSNRIGLLERYKLQIGALAVGLTTASPVLADHIAPFLRAIFP